MWYHARGERCSSGRSEFGMMTLDLCLSTDIKCNANRDLCGKIFVSLFSGGIKLKSHLVQPLKEVKNPTTNAPSLSGPAS